MRPLKRPSLEGEIRRIWSPPREDSESYKRMGMEAVMQTAHVLGLNHCGPPPLQHQYRAEIAAASHRAYLLLLDKGLGKSKILLDVFASQLRRKEANAGLILCPNLTVVANWRDQVKLHRPDIQVEYCPEGVPERRTWLEDILSSVQQPQMIVMDFNSLQTLFSQPAGKKGLEPNTALLERFAQRLDWAALDEAHFTRNQETLRFDLVKAVLKYTKRRYGATATLFNQDPMEAWPVLYLLDGGETLGHTLHAFHIAYCHKVKNRFTHSGFEWAFDPRRQDIFMQRLRSIALSYEITECADLPEREFVKVELPASPEQRQAENAIIKELKDKLSHATAEQPVTFKAKSCWVQLRRIASGFFPGKPKDDDGDAEAPVAMAISPKLDWLAARAAQWNEPLVVFYEYTCTGEQIYHVLSRLGPTGWLYAGTQNKGQLLRDWKSGKLQYIVIQSAVGGTALDLQRARRAVFFESPVSAILRSQTEGRVWRLGQDRKTYIYDLSIAGSREPDVLQRARRGMSLHAAITGMITHELSTEARAANSLQSP